MYYKVNKYLSALLLLFLSALLLLFLSVVGQYPDTTQQNGTWQVGAIVYENDDAPSPTAYYVAPGGSDAAAGTFAAPWATFEYAFNHAISPGDTVYFRGGVYNITTEQSPNVVLTGTALNPICFFNYPGEEPIIDGVNRTVDGAGIFFEEASYIKFKGITIRNIQQKAYNNRGSHGMYFYLCDNITVENCTAHDIGIRGFYTFDCDEISFINCDAYNCVDPLSDHPGNNGDGFMAGGNSNDTTYNIYYRSCRAWHNSDDGWDVHIEGYVELDSCWAINNGGYPEYLYGNGFKLNLSTDQQCLAVKRKVTNCIAVYNRGSGISTNDNDRVAKPMHIYNNTSAYNGTYGNGGYGFAGFNTSSADEYELLRDFKNNIAYSNTTASVSFTSSSLYTHDHNSWDISGLTLRASDFVSIDSTGITGDRTALGYLPTITFLKLSDKSQAIDKGVDVGIAYESTAPDLGYVEFTDYETPPNVPELATRYPSIVRTNSIYTGGYLIEDYDESITAKGVCYNTTGTPTIADSKVSGGTGVADFNVTLIGLTANETYYIRAYATNATGTGYGAIYTIKTDKWNYLYHGGKIVTHNGKPVIVR